MDTQEGTETKKKRITIADLKRDLQEVEKVIGEDILEKLVDHEIRIEKIEAGSLSNREDVAADIAARLSALENGFLADAPPVWGEIDKRITALEDATGTLADAVRSLIAAGGRGHARMEDAEDSIHSLQAALTDTQESATHTEPIPLPRPIPEPGRRVDLAALKAIAQVAQNMGDVLHMTRALKASSELNDQERREIISIACIAADVPYADNLLARAGVRSFEA